MKFVSKSANLMLVLKQGFPGNHLTGTAPISGVYIKFQNGVVEVKEQSLIDLMLKHSGFNTDYIAVMDEQRDPFEYNRNESEPAHTLTEIKYGHVEKSVGNKRTVNLSPEIRALLNEEAIKMAKAMLPSMLKEVLKDMQNGNASTPTKEEGDTLEKEETSIGKEENFIKEEKISNLNIVKPQFCDSCNSKGVRHLKECPKFK